MPKKKGGDSNQFLQQNLKAKQPPKPSKPKNDLYKHAMKKHADFWAKEVEKAPKGPILPSQDLALQVTALITTMRCVKSC